MLRARADDKADILLDAVLGAIEQILAPVGIAAAQVAHNLPIDVKAEGLRSLEETHPDLVGQ